MIVTQNYAQASTATIEPDLFKLNVSTEQSRPPVRLHATIKDGRGYARLMGALYAVVTGDQRTPKPDRTAYMAWVQERYLDELSPEDAKIVASLPVWSQERDQLKAKIGEITERINSSMNIANSGEYWHARSRYYRYLWEYDRETARLLDPVVSVHPDCIIFEAFSLDESSYGRVTVPMTGLDLRDKVDYGTTNIDFSADLAREIARIRSYRSTDLQVGPDKVVLFTKAGGVVERKIDLPSSWVRGFLQVQSAGTLPGLDVQLSAGTLAEVLSLLRSRREDKGPRSLRFVLNPGQKPTLVVEPWGVTITEPQYAYTGSQAQEVRVWGRRRLLVLEALLPFAEHVQVRLLGTGMPSYWSVFAGGSRFDLGVSGWTQNDWSASAQFDLLASVGGGNITLSSEQLKLVEQVLQDKLFASSEVVASSTGLSREIATAALQQLCRDGRVMYDHVNHYYRWRQLFPFMLEPDTTAPDPRLSAARKLLEKKAVVWSAAPLKNPPQSINAPKAVVTWRKFEFRDAKSSKFWDILLEKAAYTVRFGKIGTKGQEQTKEFDTPKEARVATDKLIKEKTSKGYTEITPAPTVVSVVATASEAAAQSANATNPTDNGKTRFQANVTGESNKVFAVVVDLDIDGRVAQAQCTCGTFRRDKLRKGPCVHILATTLLAGQQVAQGEAIHA